MQLHPQLLKDTIYLGKFELSHVLLMNDTNYPWVILVPDRDDIVEIFQLTTADQQRLNYESIVLSEYLHGEFNADKINVAALGNVVPQLHVHHIVRYKNDKSWPAPVWAKFPAKAYGEDSLEEMKSRLVEGLSLLKLGFVTADE